MKTLAERSRGRGTCTEPARLQPSSGVEGFEEFFERHRHGLGRLALLLTGDVTAAEDLTGDVFLAVWKQWPTISGVAAPVPYVRRMMVNTAASRLRRLSREWRRLLLVHGAQSEIVHDPDGAASVDVREALLRLPVRRRACVVLRHAFDLSEAEVAGVLGVTVGTVKSQTSKGMAQLHELLTSTEHGVRLPCPPSPRDGHRLGAAGCTSGRHDAGGR